MGARIPMSVRILHSLSCQAVQLNNIDTGVDTGVEPICMNLDFPQWTESKQKLAPNPSWVKIELEPYRVLGPLPEDTGAGSAPFRCGCWIWSMYSTISRP